MEIAGRQIDWDKILRRAVRNTCEKMRKSEEDPFHYPSSLRLDEPTLCQMLESDVWRLLLAVMATGTPTEPSAEEAVAEIIRRGLSKENIRFRKNGFRLSLPNRCFLVSKQQKGFSSSPYVKDRAAQVYPCQAEGLNSKDFAELVFLYDTLARDVDNAAERVIEEFRQIRLQKEKEQTAREVIGKTIEILLDEFIEPLGLFCKYSVIGDRVRMELEMHKKTTFDVPLEELAEKLKDSEKILASLETVDKMGRPRSLGIGPYISGQIIV